ncbi:MAG: GAF domain-containing protein [Reichenbachiella sp.]|uniref:GAF domain-containing protein n=1 Tax=Reichenbachiella sp. TaxID=2184521 RepID=UPI003297F6F2
MSENLFLPETESRVEKYEALIPQIEALISTESDLVANLANVAAALKEGMGFFWVGFYLVKEEELVLGPFQGPIACTRIKKGKGVCGTAWAEKRTVLVEDVDQFPGHIACSSASKSEIVLPAIKGDEVKLILDIDSDQLADFNQEDQVHLERLMKIIETKL